MGSTSDERIRLPRNERRAQLLESAQAMFVAGGYHATAMDDIAEHAGVSKPVLYQHFKSKLELYLALVEHHSDKLVGTLRAAMAATDDNKRRVNSAMQAFFDFVDAHGEAFRLLFESDQRNDPAVAIIVGQMEKQCAAALVDTIMADAGVDKNRADLLATALVGLAEISARKWMADGRPIPKEEAVALLSTLAWRGISYFPKEEK